MEMGEKIQKWKETYQNFEGLQSQVKQVQEELMGYNSAMSSLNDTEEFKSDEDKAPILNLFNRDAEVLKHRYDWIVLGTQRAQKNLEELSKRENLRGTLDNLYKEDLESTVDMIYNANPEKEGLSDNYKQAAKLQLEIRKINETLQYLQNGDTRRDMENILENVSRGLISEHYEKIYPTSEDNPNPTYDLIKRGLNLVADRDENFRLSKYVNLVPEMIEKKKEDFRNLIGNNKSNLISYISDTIEDKQIPELYMGISQYLENKTE